MLGLIKILFISFITGLIGTAIIIEIIDWIQRKPLQNNKINMKYLPVDVCILIEKFDINIHPENYWYEHRTKNRLYKYTTNKKETDTIETKKYCIAITEEELLNNSKNIAIKEIEAESPKTNIENPSENTQTIIARKEADIKRKIKETLYYDRNTRNEKYQRTEDFLSKKISQINQNKRYFQSGQEETLRYKKSVNQQIERDFETEMLRIKKKGTSPVIAHHSQNQNITREAMQQAYRAMTASEVNRNINGEWIYPPNFEDEN